MSAVVAVAAVALPAAPAAPAAALARSADLGAGQPSPRLRAVCPQDQPAMRRFIQGLGAASRRLRFHGGVKADSQRLLDFLTLADGRRHIALVAVLRCDDGERIVGEARCVRGEGGAPAEIAMVVDDAWQGRGLAQALLRALRAAADEAGIRTLVADVLTHNARMAGFLRREGFRPDGDSGDAGDPEVQRWCCTPAPAARQRQATAGAGWWARLASLAGTPGWR